jgi:hypothetical protein
MNNLSMISIIFLAPLGYAYCLYGIPHPSKQIAPGLHCLLYVLYKARIGPIYGLVDVLHPRLALELDKAHYVERQCGDSGEIYHS